MARRTGSTCRVAADPRGGPARRPAARDEDHPHRPRRDPRSRSTASRILSDPWWRGPCFGAQWWNPSRAASGRPRSRRGGLHLHLARPSRPFSSGHAVGPSAAARRYLRRPKPQSRSRCATFGFEGDRVRRRRRDRADRQGARAHHAHRQRRHADDRQRRDAGLHQHQRCAALGCAFGAGAFIARLRALFARINYVYCGYGVASHSRTATRYPAWTGS